MYDIKILEETLGGGPCLIQGDRSRTFDNAKSIHESNETSITFCKQGGQEGLRLIEKSLASVVVCSSELTLPSSLLTEKLFVLVEDPRLTFIGMVASLFQDKPRYGIHPTAQVAPTATVHPDVHIGPNCHIGDGVSIQEGSILYGQVTVYPDVRIGKNVILHAGVVIGADGFGYSRDREGVWRRFPHLGDVIIEDNVEIGPNSCIDRGTLGSTLIKRGVKLDNLVYVGHNAVIGEHTGISGNTTIGGSVIGKFCWIAPGCTVKEKITIGDNSFIGIASVVVEDVEEGSFMLGYPARKISRNQDIYPKDREGAE
jgi:UDP-3-O-[3-hydroxymyristoyl] glucosamine N-acyltransferase